MKFRWTIKELKTISDDKLIDRLIVERRSTLNMGCPLDMRLGSLAAHREKQELTPNSLEICRDLVHLEKTSMSVRLIRSLIARAKDAMTRIP